MAADNKILGQFDLIGIPPAPRGIPQVEVGFDIDANGIVNVNAKDKGTGKEQSIVITASQKLSEEDIEKMKQDATSHAEDDRKRKEEIEVINQADQAVYAGEQSMKDMEGKIAKEKVEALKGKLEELKKLMAEKERDIKAIKTKLDEFQKVSGEAAQELYQKAAAEQAKAGKGKESADTKAKGKEKVVDADYEVEKEKEKGKA